MRFALLAIALSLAACGDPADNSGGMDGGASVDAGIDELTAYGLCLRDAPARTFTRQDDVPACADAAYLPCPSDVLAMCPRGTPYCCWRTERCGAVGYQHCLR